MARVTMNLCASKPQASTVTGAASRQIKPSTKRGRRMKELWPDFRLRRVHAVVVSVIRPRSIPSTTAVHCSPGAIACASVSVPELTSSPPSSTGSPRHGRRELAKTKCGASKRVLSRILGHELSVPGEPNTELGEVLDESRNRRGVDRARLTHHERRMQPVRGDEVRRPTRCRKGRSSSCPTARKAAHRTNPR